MSVRKLDLNCVSGETGRKKINQYTRYLTVVLAIVQGYGFAVGLESAGAVTDPGIYGLDQRRSAGCLQL